VPALSDRRRAPFLKMQDEASLVRAALLALCARWGVVRLRARVAIVSQRFVMPA
jgi:hypothetical protein